MTQTSTATAHGLTDRQAVDLATIADVAPRPGLVNANRLRWFADHGLVTLEARGTGRGRWTAATITDLGLVTLGRSADADEEGDEDAPEPIGQSAREAVNLLGAYAADHVGDDRAIELRDEVAARIAELEAQLERYRSRTEKLVTALEQQRDHGGGVQLSAKVTGQFVALATLAGIDLGTRGQLPPFRAEFAQAAARTGVDPTARELLAAAGVTVRKLLPGEAVAVTEHAGRGATRALGVLYRSNDGARELLWTDGNMQQEPVDERLLADYLAAVRELGCPTPSARRRALERVRSAG